ncbi:regulator of G-protein signaling loco-like isoform X2 [Haematobia irritans]|uniref:regulator of G-protein signaling loco-like isoform X2 n=1 Tax=Haematobia irritans TaxID=7368 RepID=UPI003F4F86B4
MFVTRILPNSSSNTSPFRRVWEQSSLRSSRSDKYTLSPKPTSSKNSKHHCAYLMIASANNAFLGTTSGKDGSKRLLSTEKMTSSNAAATKSPRVSAWAISFEHLLEDTAGLATFAQFLKLEFSAENIYFWTSCERYKNTENVNERQVQAKQIFGKYLSSSGSEPVNLDSHTRNISEEDLQKADKDLFLKAQKQIFHLMKFDSYQRFIRSELYKHCQNAEEKHQPLPYGDDNLDVLLKTNFLQSASPKLKKSASNAEDRRRKILLPWHRKTRSKSRDRMDMVCDELPEPLDGSNPCLNAALALPSQKLTLAKPSENFDSQNLRSSLPSSLKSLNSSCSLCRVKFADEATTIVQIKPTETVGQLVERLLEKRGLRYKLYDVQIKSLNKSIDLEASSQEIAGEEVEIEQRVTFKLYLPDPKVISVKSKPKKYLHEVVRPILQKYNYDTDSVDILRRDTMDTLDLQQLVTTVDEQRLHVVLRKCIPPAIHDSNKNGADYQNDNIALHYMKSKELANEFIARNAKTNIKSSSVSSSEGNLIEATNNIFHDIIKGKTHPGNKSQNIDQYSLKSDEYGSENSVFYDTMNSNKGSATNLRSRLKNPIVTKTHSSENNIAGNEMNKPIIAKLKAGVKLQVTERVAEKQDELLISLKTRLDNQTTNSNINSKDLSADTAKTKENHNDTALVLRHIRSNLSPVNKTYNSTTIETLLSHEKPSNGGDRPCIPLKRSSVLSNNEEFSNHAEADETSAAYKGPPPLPPKPKVLPTKPSNWGATNSD